MFNKETNLNKMEKVESGKFLYFAQCRYVCVRESVNQCSLGMATLRSVLLPITTSNLFVMFPISVTT